MAITVELAGVEYRAEDFNINTSSSGRSEISIELREYIQSSAQFWDTLIVYLDGTRVFEGIATYVEIYAPDNNNESEHYYTLRGADYTEITKYRVVAAIVEDKTAAEAITDYILPILAEEGITAGTISADWNIERDVWSYEYIYDIMEKLISAAPGYIWFIDMDKKLHYYPKSQGDLVYLRDTDQFTDFRRIRDFTNYRNTQYAKVNEIRTGIQYNKIPSPLPDGTVKTYTLNFAVAEKPTIYIDSVAVDSDAVGVNGIDADTADSGIEWFFSYNSNTITQATNETALAEGVELKVTYVGLRHGVISFADYSKIQTRSENVPDFSGKSENVVELTKFDTIDQVSYYVEQLINVYGNTGNQMTFTTTEDKFEVGKRLQLLARGYNVQFMIDQVTITTDGYILFYAVTASDAAYDGGSWEEYFYKMIVGSKTYSLNSSDILYQTISTPENMDISGEYTFGLTGTGLILPFTLPGILGGSDYTEVIIND